MSITLNKNERDADQESTNNQYITWSKLSNNINKNSMDQLDGLLKNSVLALKKPAVIQQQLEEHLQFRY